MLEKTLFWGYQAILVLGAIAVLFRETMLPHDVERIRRGPQSGVVLWAGFGSLLGASVLVLMIADVSAPRLTLLVLDVIWAVILFRSPWFRDRLVDFVRWLGAERSGNPPAGRGSTNGDLP